MSTTNNVLFISDLHSGCRLALCPPKGIRLDDGGKYTPSPLQKKLWAMWREFWDEWVPEATNGEPFDLVMNGDALNGTPHQAKSNISDNWADQHHICRELMVPVLENKKLRDYYHIRGTEAHVGKSAEHEEILAESLDAKPNEEGMYSRYDLWKKIGTNKLIHALHHIGTTGSQSYEASAVCKELVEEFAEAARWRNTPPDVIVRSHRHRAYEIGMPVGTPVGDKYSTGRAFAVVTPCWQGKTAFVWKIPGGRLSTPQFGGVLVHYSKTHNEVFVRTKVWTVQRSRTEE